MASADTCADSRRGRAPVRRSGERIASDVVETRRYSRCLLAEAAASASFTASRQLLSRQPATLQAAATRRCRDAPARHAAASQRMREQHAQPRAAMPGSTPPATAPASSMLPRIAPFVNSRSKRCCHGPSPAANMPPPASPTLPAGRPYLPPPARRAQARAHEFPFAPGGAEENILYKRRWFTRRCNTEYSQFRIEDMILFWPRANAPPPIRVAFRASASFFSRLMPQAFCTPASRHSECAAAAAHVLSRVSPQRAHAKRALMSPTPPVESPCPRRPATRRATVIARLYAICSMPR